ncbi:MAG TPA: DUF3137 domain-containing protein [Hanamia sp.]|nr:DUF3137 domain-containing protein [Hanamia sp.]
MNRKNDFESFYDAKLKPTLSYLKLQSSEASGWRIAGLLFLMFAIMCLLLSQIIVGILLLCFVMISVYKYRKKKKLFIKNFKETAIREIIKYLEPGLIYKPNENISPVDYEKSGLYRRIYDYYEGGDLISGNYNNLKFYCSELETSYDKSPGGNTITTIFKGLFFAIPLKIYLPGVIYVWPKGEEQLTINFMDEYYRLFPLPEVYPVDLNDKVFENNFSVYSSNPVDISFSSFVDQELKECLINLKEQVGKEIRFSIMRGICYLSISINKEFLKPSLSNSENIEIVKEYYSTVQLILNVIDQLNLKRFT